MVKRLKIKKYRKLKDIDIAFSEHLNAISGTNGTCKTSLLHLISNSVQAVTSKCDWITDKNCIKSLRSLNNTINPKVETLTKGDKIYNDPAHGQRGVLFTVEYVNNISLGFRRHNSSVNYRYAVKPQYKRGIHEKLPYCPVIYMGLSRLIPYGEFQDDSRIFKVENLLPKKYKTEISNLYKDFTSYKIQLADAQQIGKEKVRTEFSTTSEGIDSNTISAGEDNLYIIITALITLKYYYESIVSKNSIESILLIDEFDASLHPAFQIKLLKLFREFSEAYKIQIIFTTHSLTTLDDMFKNHDKVVYLIDNITDIIPLENPDLYKIQMHLNTITKQELFADKIIPVFSEDAEARDFINSLFDYFEEIHESFKEVRKYFYFVNVNIGADSLTGIFKDIKLLHSTKFICILDGDHESDLTNKIIALPGKNSKNQNSKLSPENLLFQYVEQLYIDDASFWKESTALDKGYTKHFYLERIKQDIEKYTADKAQNCTTKKEREFNKELYQKYRDFFLLIFSYWLHDKNNQVEIHKFFDNLHKLFLKNAVYNGISPNLWKND